MLSISLGVILHNARRSSFEFRVSSLPELMTILVSLSWMVSMTSSFQCGLIEELRAFFTVGKTLSMTFSMSTASGVFSSLETLLSMSV